MIKIPRLNEYKGENILIVAAMATMPERLPHLENAVEALRPQVDVLRVYLNNFVEIPKFLSEEEAVLSVKLPF